MIGILGTNPESWRLHELRKVLVEREVGHKALFPWLFSADLLGGSPVTRYDGQEIGTGEELDLDIVYVASLGFRELPETLYKLRLLRELESNGIRIVNPADTISMCRNKADQSFQIIDRGLKMPPTMITESVHLALEFIMDNRPCVLKPITGLQGKGILMIPSGMEMGDVVDYVSWFQARYGKDVIYAQKYIEHPDYDIRALVVGDEVLSKMRRVSEESWRTNISAGGIPVRSDDDIDSMALEAARAVKGEIVGVDILPSLDGEYYVLEVNAFPGWTGLQEVTDFSISEAVVDYLCSLL